MKEADRQKRNKDRLGELYRAFRARVQKVIVDLKIEEAELSRVFKTRGGRRRINR